MLCADCCDDELVIFSAEAIGAFVSPVSSLLAISVKAGGETALTNSSLIGVGWATTADGMACDEGRDDETETFVAGTMGRFGSSMSGLAAVSIQARGETAFVN